MGNFIYFCKVYSHIKQQHIDEIDYQTRRLFAKEDDKDIMCTFLFIVLPTLAIRGLWKGACWLYSYMTGKKTTQPKEVKKTVPQKEAPKQKVESGFCPYTFIMD